MIRRIRRSLAGRATPVPYAPTRHRRCFDAAFWLVRIYYAATLLFAYQEMSTLWKLIETGGDFSPLWPIFWAADVRTTGLVLLPFLIGSALLAVALPDRRWPRVLVFFSFLFASAFRSSFGMGSINHGNHYWIWISLCFCFLPSGDRETLRRSLDSRYRFLLVFAFTQGFILLFYTMSGFWKTVAGIEALILGRVGSFHPEALATAAASKMIQMDGETLLGPWLAENVWAGWPIHLFIIYIELFALWIWLRPSLHRAFGVALACFHIGTFMLLGINFPKHVLVLTILMIWSPFAPDRPMLADALKSLPVFGWLFYRGKRRASAGEEAIGDTGELTRPGGAI